MTTIVILALCGLVLVLGYSIVGLMDEVRIRDEALEWLYDEGHISETAARQVSEMIALPHE